MGAVLINLFPIVVGAAIVPLWLTLTLLVLQGPDGAVRAGAFAAGAMTMRLLQGALFGYVFAAEPDADRVAGSDLIVSALMLLIGIVLLVTFVRTLFGQDDPDAPPPGWLAHAGSLSAPVMFGVGAALMALSVKQWVFTLSAIAIINDAEVGRPRSVLAYLVFVVTAQALVLAPVIYSVASPSRARTMLEAAQRWIERSGRGLTIAVSLGFGVLFLWLGLAGVTAKHEPEEPPPPGFQNAAAADGAEV
jgi:uncharacterized membrane protein